MGSILLKLLGPAVIRSVLIAAGGFVLGRGYLDSDTWNTIAGIIMALVGGTWSAVQKVDVAKKVAVLDQAARTSPNTVASAAIVVGVPPAKVGVAYPNNPPTGR